MVNEIMSMPVCLQFGSLGLTTSVTVPSGWGKQCLEGIIYETEVPGFLGQFMVLEDESQ